jgi:REP element-mobilizing transposase RayT
MAYHQRHLPHWQPEDAAVFVTWRLNGSLPKHVLVRQDEVSAGRAFVEFDRLLDRAETGPTWLKDPRIAKSAVDALKFGETDLHLYELVAFVVMSNHVHVLIRPNSDLSKITRAIKGYTAREANRILDSTGQPFWQDESYDRWIRDEAAFHRVVRYIEGNPVSAGLAGRIEEYPWSSALQIA